MPKKIGFFGGSFNPIHNGHLNVAIAVKEKCGFDKVLLCPSFYSPFGKEIASPLERLHMVRLAVDGINGLEACDLEIRRGGISYTIDSLRELQKAFPKDFIRLIISDDLLERFSNWKEAEAILASFSPIVAHRLYRGEVPPTGFESIDIPLMEISSTEIRDRIIKNLPCHHLMPLPCYNHSINVYN